MSTCHIMSFIYNFAWYNSSRISTLKVHHILYQIPVHGFIYFTLLLEWNIGFSPKTCRVFHLSDIWIQSSDCSIVFISVIITVSKLCEKREVVQGPIIISHFLIHVQKKIELMPYFSYKPLKHARLFIETSNTCTTALF